MFISPKIIRDGFLILTWCKLELLLVRFEGQLCIGKEAFWEQVTSWEFIKTFSDECGFILKSSEKTFSFSLLSLRLTGVETLELVSQKLKRRFHFFNLVSDFFSKWKLSI